MTHSNMTGKMPTENKRNGPKDRKKVIRDSIRKFDMCDMLVYPKELGRFSTFLENDLDTIFELGYQEAKKSIEEASGSLPVS